MLGNQSNLREERLGQCPSRAGKLNLAARRSGCCELPSDSSSGPALRRSGAALPKVVPLVRVWGDRSRVFFLNNFYWSIFALQCYMSFCGTANWISHTDTSCPLFCKFPSRWGKFPVPYIRSSLPSSYVTSIMCIYINPNLPIHPTTPLPW